MGIRLRMQDSLTLCAGCEHVQLIKAIDGTTKTLCHATPFGTSPVITKPVIECSYYERRGQTRHDMEKSAWILEIKKGKVMGFMTPEERKKREE